MRRRSRRLGWQEVVKRQARHAARMVPRGSAAMWWEQAVHALFYPARANAAGANWLVRTALRHALLTNGNSGKQADARRASRPGGPLANRRVCVFAQSTGQICPPWHKHGLTGCTRVASANAHVGPVTRAITDCIRVLLHTALVSSSGSGSTGAHAQRPCIQPTVTTTAVLVFTCILYS